MLTMLLPIAVLLFVLGACVGSQVNRGIYRLAWHTRPIGPWSLPHEQAPPRRWYDRIPIFGWWWLRRESSLHGAAYWLRPMLIELSMAAGFVALYAYEVVEAQAFVFPSRIDFVPDLFTLQTQYATHLVLISLMVVATFIDFDEQTIPDAITIPGTILGLLLLAALPQARPFVTVPAINRHGWTVDHVHLTSPTLPNQDWPSWLDGPFGLTLGFACLLGWWLAVLPWFWTSRRGWIKGLQYLIASGRRGINGIMVTLLAVGAGTAGIAWFLGGDHWESLLSALVGVAAGGGMIWAVRILAGRALGQEAMGFGDVTLMAMIGAFTGWQATLIVFFLAPFAALFIAGAQWLLTRRKDIAFGPYLCLAALVSIVQWGAIWEPRARSIFSLGWWVPGIFACGLCLMWGMLTLLRFVRELGEPEIESQRADNRR